jgi:hypothetical protein
VTLPAAIPTLCSPVVNLTNILLEPYLYKSVLCSFSLVSFVIFWCKNIGAKAACKMLVKLTPVANFTNILQAAYAPIFL